MMISTKSNPCWNSGVIMIEITSSKNEGFKLALSLKQRKSRYKENAFLLEGIKGIRHAMSVQAEVKAIYFNLAQLSQPELIELESEALSIGIKTYGLCHDLFEQLADTVNPQGAVAIVTMPTFDAELKKGGLYIALDRIQDPGNLGTIIRTADAAGVDGIICADGTVDAYNEKVLRSTMGSVFSMPVTYVKNLAQTLRTAKSEDFKVYCTALQNSVDYETADYSGSVILVIGNEAQGAAQEIQALATLNIIIPIYGSAESLNASVAAGIVMYAAAKSRNS